ncbi:hypothetical protein P3G55_08935 [Leptospira sp. 96542]|nr:hypothetical protein [Leptospira sp. 96542]
MDPKLFYLDSLFEYKLAQPEPKLDSALLRRNRCLEQMFLPISRPEDFVLVQELPSETLFGHWKESGLELGTPILTPATLTECILVEWGNLHRLEDHELIEDADLYQAARLLNSKVFQWELRSKHSPLNCKVVSSEEHLASELESGFYPSVIKSEFGLAGRNQIIVKNANDGWKLSQIPKRLFGFPVLLEEWVGESRVFDFSTLWDVKDSKFQYITSTVMMIDPEGQFRGIRILPGEIPYSDLFLPLTHSLTRDTEPLIPSYTGPCSIDGFVFKRNGLEIQPVSEFNFRYSIGRILWEVRKKRKAFEKVSGIFILPFPKLGNPNEWDWIQRLNETGEGMCIFLTPVRDFKNKPYQNSVLYYETTESQEETFLANIWETWNI